MLSQSTQRFRNIFLIEFTTELLKNSIGEVDKLENVLDDEDDEIKNKVKNFLKEHDEGSLKDYSASKKIKEDFFELDKPIFNLASKPVMSKRPVLRVPQKRVLRIPEPRLPTRLNYLRPVPTNKEIDIGKLNAIVKDPGVKVIQCNGPNEKITVIGSMGTKPTGIVLSKEEINNIIKKFSDSSKIPIEEGVTRIVAGRLILLALVSKVVDPRFTIKKISPMPSPPALR